MCAQVGYTVRWEVGLFGVCVVGGIGASALVHLQAGGLVLAKRVFAMP